MRVEAEHVARRVLDVLRDPFTVSGTSVTVRASLGIAVADNSDANATSLMRHADVAMYVAKGAGRNRYVLFAPGMESEVVHRRKLRGELEHAMELNQFILHYQPVVNLITGEITAVEALVRWHHPLRGIVAPGEFIGVAEESGLIMQLGEFVLRTACATTLQLQRLQATPLAVCVNVSVVQLNAPTFVEDVLAIVAETGLAPDTLILELTESMFVEDTAIVTAKLEALRSAGIRVAIDDFGTGYSSLSYLRRLPVDILKIAKPFVDDLASGADEDFTRAIVTIADALQLHVIAEGIEAASQVTRLLSLGCLAGQGYHLCHPLPADEIEQLLRHGGIDRRGSRPSPSRPGEPHAHCGCSASRMSSGSPSLALAWSSRWRSPASRGRRCDARRRASVSCTATSLGAARGPRPRRRVGRRAPSRVPAFRCRLRRADPHPRDRYRRCVPDHHARRRRRST